MPARPRRVAALIVVGAVVEVRAGPARRDCSCTWEAKSRWVAAEPSSSPFAGEPRNAAPLLNTTIWLPGAHGRRNTAPCQADVQRTSVCQLVEVASQVRSWNAPPGGSAPATRTSRVGRWVTGTFAAGCGSVAAPGFRDDAVVVGRRGRPSWSAPRCHQPPRPPSPPPRRGRRPPLGRSPGRRRRRRRRRPCPFLSVDPCVAPSDVPSEV